MFTPEVITVGWARIKGWRFGSIQKSNGRILGGRRRVGKPKGKWENGVWKDVKDLLQIRRKKIEETMARKQGETPHN